MLAEKMNMADWLAELADVAAALYDHNARIAKWESKTFAVFHDGEIFPLDNNTRLMLNQDIAYYRKNPDCRIDNQYSNSTAESEWRLGVGGTKD